MKKSINAWSVENSMGFSEMFMSLADAGFEAVELNLDAAGRSEHSLSMETTDEELLAVRNMAEVAGIGIASVSSSLYGYCMSNADTKHLKDVMRHQIHCAKMLGCDAILAVPGADINGGADIKTSYDACFSFLADMKTEIEQEQIYVCLENVWNGFFTSPFDMASFIDRLNSPYIRAYYDVGNVVAFSDTASWIRVLGNRIYRIHIKDFKRNTAINRGGTFVDLLAGDIDWDKVVCALEDIGYEGYVTAEVFPTKEYDDMQTFYKEVYLQETKILGGK